jgi:hypothetical protein
VERVADLVYGPRLLLHEPPLGVERALLEEEPNLVAGVEKVLVGAARLLAGREDGENFARLEDEEAVALVGFELCGREHRRRLQI